MNTQLQTAPTTRLASIAFAAVLTLSMLLGVNTLASKDVTSTHNAQLAQTSTATHS